MTHKHMARLVDGRELFTIIHKMMVTHNPDLLDNPTQMFIEITWALTPGILSMADKCEHNADLLPEHIPLVQGFSAAIDDLLEQMGLPIHSYLRNETHVYLSIDGKTFYPIAKSSIIDANKIVFLGSTWPVESSDVHLFHRYTIHEVSENANSQPDIHETQEA